ncbi:MAG: trp operon repressor [Micrococcales bacterium]|nr:trp operon repressor [Micrococcales bacterium]MCL2667749.1 trp operon repressor [Micrococcales bacterium]
MSALANEYRAWRRAQARADRAARSLVAARLREGLTQRQVAAELGASQGEVNRLARSSSAKDAAGEPRRWMTARDAADAVRQAHDDPMWALRMVVQARDHLRTLTDPDDVAEWALTPPPLAHPGFDTLLAALARDELTAAGHDVPPWATPRRLPDPWVLAATDQRRPRVVARTPEHLAALNVFVSAADLVTA